MTPPGRGDGDRSAPRVAVLGAGPVGLDAALAAADRGWPFTVYEAGDRPAAHVRRWSHVRLFSPWSMNASPRMRRRLSGEGATVPADDDVCPTGEELLARVLDPVAALPEVAANLRLGTRAVAVGRERLLKHDAPGSPDRARHPFRLLLEGADGRRETAAADVVLDCTGTYSNPNATGDGGVPAPGERELDDRIERHVPDVRGNPDEWAGLDVLLVGGGHSAQTAARDLSSLAEDRPGTRIHWALRSEEPGWQRVPDDPLPERDRLTARAERLASEPGPGVVPHRGVVVDRLARRDGRVAAELRRGNGATETVEVDRVVSLTGYVGDPGIYRQLQVHECWATSGPMSLAAELLDADATDCLDQESHGVESLRSPEPDFFILGSKSYGRNNTFLLTIGWEQVDEVFGALEGRG